MATVAGSQLDWSTQDLLPELDGDSALAEMAPPLCFHLPEGVPLWLLQQYSELRVMDNRENTSKAQTLFPLLGATSTVTCKQHNKLILKHLPTPGLLLSSIAPSNDRVPDIFRHNDTQVCSLLLFHSSFQRDLVLFSMCTLWSAALSAALNIHVKLLGSGSESTAV